MYLDCEKCYDMRQDKLDWNNYRGHIDLCLSKATHQVANTWSLSCGRLLVSTWYLESITQSEQLATIKSFTWHSQPVKSRKCLPHFDKCGRARPKLTVLSRLWRKGLLKPCIYWTVGHVVFQPAFSTSRTEPVPVPFTSLVPVLLGRYRYLVIHSLRN
jgi:hypothetical protein